MTTQKSNNARRKPMAWCSQPGCVHGAEYRVNITGKLMCQRCKNLFANHEITRLETT
jgi:hypothetical protein